MPTQLEDDQPDLPTAGEDPTPQPPARVPGAGPVTQTERIASLDVLRGVAVLGILIMNIQAFAMPIAAYFNPYAYGDLTGANYLVWLLSHLLADRKFMTIFSLLFGAGIALMARRREAADARPARLHYRRMAVLLVFGLFHAYLLWDGDILVTYALCGMAVYPLRRVRPARLLIVAALLIALPSGITQFFQSTMPYWPPEEVAGLEAGFWHPPAEEIAATVQTHRGSYLTLLPHRARSALMMQTFLLLVENLWRVCGLMLAGMACFKLGVLQASRSRGVYLALTGVGLLVGLPLVVGGVVFRNAADWDVHSALFFGSQFNYWGSLFVAFAWVGAVMLLCRSSALPRLRHALAAVGQMAFTNYLLQSIICTLFFYGYGLGWFGRVERLGQVAVVLAVWAFQLLLSRWWLQRFRFGPAEWLWRWGTYGRRPTWRR